jgi:cysteinyl-tRNA synthetase
LLSDLRRVRAKDQIMTTNGNFYITTAIPYVNAEPHLGHALELVQADVLARHRRLRGQAVRFLTGTDDNALKNVTAAGAAGVEVREFVHRNARQANAALHRIAVTRLRCDPRTRDYLNRRTRDGKTHREAIRCIKRYIAREVHSLISNGPTLATAELGQPLAA